MNIKRFHVGSRVSEIAVHRGRVYLAGQVAEDTTADIRGQMREVLGHIDRLLLEAGSDKQHILSTQIFISDMADFAAMNEIWDSWVSAGHAPPRATVQAQLADPGWRVEVVVVAAQHEGVARASD